MTHRNSVKLFFEFVSAIENGSLRNEKTDCRCRGTISNRVRVRIKLRSRSELVSKKQLRNSSSNCELARALHFFTGSKRD